MNAPVPLPAKAMAQVNPKNRIENLKKRWMAGDAEEKIFVYRLLDSNGGSCCALAESQEEFERCPKVEDKVDAIVYPVGLTVTGCFKACPYLPKSRRKELKLVHCSNLGESNPLRKSVAHKQNKPKDAQKEAK